MKLHKKPASIDDDDHNEEHKSFLVLIKATNDGARKHLLKVKLMPEK